MAEKDALKFKDIFRSKKRIIEALQQIDEEGYIPIWKMNIWKIRERLVAEGIEEVFGARKEDKVVALPICEGVWLVTLIKEK